MSHDGRLRSARSRLYRAAANAFSLARARVELRGTRSAARVYCFGHVLVPHRPGVAISRGAAFFAGPVPTALRCEQGGEIVVGAGTIFNYGVDVVASRRVEVGADCMIASFVHIRDTDGRRTAPVIIGDGVWIAYGAVIEPGTVIGDRAVVATLSVVSGVVPPDSLASGNPAVSMPLDAGGPTWAQVMSRGASGTGGAGDRGAPEDEPGDLASSVRAAIFEWLDDTRLFGEAARLVTSDEMSLREAGLLDSLGVVQLVVALERRFGVRIDRERATRREAQSVGGLVAIVAASPRAGAGERDGGAP